MSAPNTIMLRAHHQHISAGGYLAFSGKTKLKALLSDLFLLVHDVDVTGSWTWLYTASTLNAHSS